MFGFGKKKLVEDKDILEIAIMVGMFDSWSVDNGFGGVVESERFLLIEKLLKIENYKSGTEEISTIQLGMLMINPDYSFDLWREERKKRHFDDHVISFCESIGLPKSFYIK